MRIVHTRMFKEGTLTLIVSCLKTYIKDDWDFIRKLLYHVDYFSVLVSWGVVSFYRRISHDLGLEALPIGLTINGTYYQSTSQRSLF